ncbi:MAG: phage integrase SAM-like domain-containing protein [Ignavibacteria bacterium]|nr:phage integrase SAM-like domain-containing protein [Ignavibacteria bacterium]
MKASFYLDKPDRETTSILLNVWLSGKRIRLATGITIEPRHWLHDRQTVRTSDPQHNAHKKRLDHILRFVTDTFNKLVPSGKDKLMSSKDVEDFTTRIKEFISPDLVPKDNVPESFVDSFETFISTYTLRTRTGMITSKRPGPTTILHTRRVLKDLKEWSVKRKKPLTYEAIDEAFYQSFYKWLSDERGLSDASISNHIKALKTFMKWSREKGYHNNNEWEKFWRDRRTGDSMALIVDEIRKIRDIDLSDKPRLARVRDLFLLQLYTGMRYGDIERIGPRNFDDKEGLIRYTSEKSDTECIVPITRPLMKLLERYPSRIFEFPSPVKMNAYLKELGTLVGMTGNITIARYHNGERVEENLRRADMLATHVARRSFSSTSVQFGLSEAVISRVTGHSAKGVLQQHYIILNYAAVRDMVCKAWEQL